MANTSPASEPDLDYAPAPDLHDLVAAAVNRHGRRRVSEALGLAAATVLAIAGRTPVLSMSLIVCGMRLDALRELDRRADEARAIRDAKRDEAEESKESGQT